MTQIIETAESNQKNSFAGKFKININHKKDENLSVLAFAHGKKFCLEKRSQISRRSYETLFVSKAFCTLKAFLKCSGKSRTDFNTRYKKWSIKVRTII